MSNEKGNQVVDETASAKPDAQTDAAQKEKQAPESFTPEQLAELQEKAAKADEYWARLLREAADFENFKKRATRERQEAIKFANEGLLMKLLPIVDNFQTENLI